MTQQQQKSCNAIKQPIKIVRSSRIEYQTFEPPTCFDSLSYMLIRPPRIKYDPTMLELSKCCTSYTYTVEHIPFELSLYMPVVKPKCVVLYLHGNTSSRIEGWMILKYLPFSYGLACFDFQACGNRNGKWVTLGLKQSREVDIAVNFLKQKGFQVVGWGRSMGAVSLLMSSECQIMIVDSPFSSLKNLCYETVKTVKYLPNCIICCLFPCVYCCLKKDIHSKTQQNIYDLEVWKKVQQKDVKTSILFLSGKNDEMIGKQHSEILFNQFKGNKDLYIFQGTHNSSRNEAVYKKAIDFIELSLLRKRKIQEFYKALMVRTPSSPQEQSNIKSNQYENQKQQSQLLKQ